MVQLQYKAKVEINKTANKYFAQVESYTKVRSKTDVLIDDKKPPECSGPAGGTEENAEKIITLRKNQISKGMPNTVAHYWNNLVNYAQFLQTLTEIN